MDIWLWVLTFAGWMGFLAHAQALLEFSKRSDHPEPWSWYLLVVTVLYGILVYSQMDLLFGGGSSQAYIQTSSYLALPIILHPVILLRVILRNVREREDE